MKMLLISLALMSVSPLVSAQSGMQGASSSASASTRDVRLEAATSVRVTSALKSGRSVLFFGPQGRRIAHAALDSRGVARVIVDGRASFESAIRVTITGAEGCASQSYALVHNTSAGTRFVALVSALKTAQALSCTPSGGAQALSGNSESRGTLTSAEPSFSPNVSGGTPPSGTSSGNTGLPGTGAGGTLTGNAAGPAAGVVRLDVATRVQLGAALRAGRSVTFVDAHGRLVAHAALDASGAARVVADGSARFASAVRVTIADARTKTSQSYGLVHGASASRSLLVEAAGGLNGSGAAGGTRTLASVVNASLAAQVAASPVSASVRAVANVSTGAPNSTSSQGIKAAVNLRTVRLDPVTGVRLTAVLKAGRGVSFLDAQGRVVAHAALNAQGTAQVLADGVAPFESAIRVVISDTRTGAAQEYTLVRGPSASAVLLVEVKAAKGGAVTGNVTLASVLNTALVSVGASTAGTTGPVSVSTSAGAVGQILPGGANQSSQSAGSGSVSVSGTVSGGRVDTPSTGESSVSGPAGVSVGVSVGGTNNAGATESSSSVSVGVSGTVSGGNPAPAAPGGASGSGGVSVGVSGSVGGSGGIGVGVGVGGIGVGVGVGGH